MVAAEEAAGDVVKMDESGAVVLSEGTDDFERRLLKTSGEVRVSRCGVASEIEMEGRVDAPSRGKLRCEFGGVRDGGGGHGWQANIFSL